MKTNEKSVYSLTLAFNAELKKERSLFGVTNLLSGNKYKNELNAIWDRMNSLYSLQLERKSLTIDEVKKACSEFRVNKKAVTPYVFQVDSKGKQVDRQIFSPVTVLKALNQMYKAQAVVVPALPAAKKPETLKKDKPAAKPRAARAAKQDKRQAAKLAA